MFVVPLHREDLAKKITVSRQKQTQMEEELQAWYKELSDYHKMVRKLLEHLEIFGSIFGSWKQQNRKEYVRKQNYNFGCVYE